MSVKYECCDSEYIKILRTNNAFFVWAEMDINREQMTGGCRWPDWGGTGENQKEKKKEGKEKEGEKRKFSKKKVFFKKIANTLASY